MHPTIRRATTGDIFEWVRMRLILWPHLSADDVQADMEEVLADPEQAVFVAAREDGCLAGFLEATTRKYADGCETSPVGYIEGWFVDEDLRGNGVGAGLVRAAEDWARGLGYEEMASDTWLDNEGSIEAHRKLGYEEAERLVHFAKWLE
ncbi:MAG TPA: aminoglycoside 6'-N-acetyltransferase [Anaerolineales bacterium]|jgi:aminoglycoside 6'-N-acetyltransferase I